MNRGTRGKRENYSPPRGRHRYLSTFAAEPIRWDTRRRKKEATTTALLPSPAISSLVPSVEISVPLIYGT